MKHGSLTGSSVTQSITLLLKDYAFVDTEVYMDVF